MSSLRALIDLSRYARTMLSANEGLLTGDDEKSLAALEIKLSHRIDSFARRFEILDRLEIKHEAEIKISRERLRKVQAHREALKDRIKEAMTSNHLDEVKGSDVRFVLADAKPRLFIPDPGQLDKAYFKETITIEPDKERIREDLELGVEVEGAMLVESKSLRSYANRSAK